MPTKRQRRARNQHPQELKAWRAVFNYGHDYFGALAPLGYDTHDDEDRARHDAEEVWNRLGAEFMRNWQPRSEHHRQSPWALDEFGPPPGWER